MSKKIRFRVRCQGKLHELVLGRRGALRCVHHDGGGRCGAAFEALGEEAPLCRILRDIWIEVASGRTGDVRYNHPRFWTPKHPEHYLPEELRPAARAASKRIKQRKRFRSGNDSLSVPLQLRQLDLRCRLAKRSLASATYRGSFYHRNAYASSGAANIYLRWKRKPFRGARGAELSIPLDMCRWYSEVYRPGLALVRDGKKLFFVLSTQTGRDQSTIVHVARQSRGLAICVERALVVRPKKKGETPWRVRQWLGDPSAAATSSEKEMSASG